MRGYEIASLSEKTQKLIQKEGIDRNNDGLINQDNGELSDLLSRTGKSNINDLCYDSWVGAKVSDYVASGIFASISGVLGYNAYLYRPKKITMSQIENEAKYLYDMHNSLKPKPMSLDIPYNPPKPAVSRYENPAYLWFKEHGAEKEAAEFLKKLEQAEKETVKRYDMDYKENIEAIKEHNRKVASRKPNVSMKKCTEDAKKLLKSAARREKFLFGLFGAISLGMLSIATCLLAAKPGKGIAKFTGSDDYIPVERARSSFEDQYRQVFGEETELKEYTPQKGEYWTSILKAKYGVDDATAQRMAHKIKEVIYEDSLAAKQSPVMYLPQTWTFEGKMYNYNENAQVVQTEKYSDDVKTEMGKMNKDIKYE